MHSPFLFSHGSPTSNSSAFYSFLISSLRSLVKFALARYDWKSSYASQVRNTVYPTLLHLLRNSGFVGEYGYSQQISPFLRVNYIQRLTACYSEDGLNHATASNSKISLASNRAGLFLTHAVCSSQVGSGEENFVIYSGTWLMGDYIIWKVSSHCGRWQGTSYTNSY